METFELAWSHGRAEVVSTAGMLTRCRFELEGGGFEPLALAPWLDETLEEATPGHLAVLGGEFVGLPFGSAGRPAELDARWSEVAFEPQQPAHGIAAELDWQQIRATRNSVTLGLRYPADSPIERLERTVEGVAGEPRLHLRLVVHSRRESLTPMGLHPIFRLPDEPGALLLDAEFAEGFTYPGRVHGASWASAPGGRFADLAAVPNGARSTDFSRLPFGRPTEEVLQLCGVNGPIRVLYPGEGYGVELEWDRSLLPSLLVWLSDRGIAEPPWSGRYRGLGLEPIAAAFDLPASASSRPNPISADGFATALSLTPDRPTVVDYSISAFSTERLLTKGTPQ